MLLETKQLCALYGIKPKHSQGQNFLINADVYKKIIEIAKLNSEDYIVEVGPGLGFLTMELAQKVKHVLAVELDSKLAKVLQSRLLSYKTKNVSVLNADILDWEQFHNKPRGDYKIVANLPYNITSIFLRKFLETKHAPTLLVLMLQKEVAQRIVALPGQMSLLALSVQFYAHAEINFFVPAEDFWPRPQVDSAVISIKVKKKEELALKNKEDIKLFFRLLKISFSSKRKMLKNNLGSGIKIDSLELEKVFQQSGLSFKMRAQDLSLKEWLELFGILKKNMI